MQSQSAELSQACSALWLATVSLMTAFMQQQAPAHRYLLASRISRNFATLGGQPCFEQHTRKTFADLAGRWERKARALSPANEASPNLIARLQRLLAG